MRRVMFTLGTRNIYSYPMMQYIGLCVGVVAGDAAARTIGLDARIVFAATCLLLVPALAGARVLHVVTHWSFYKNRRSLIWNRNAGGAAQYGGILLAVPLSVPLLRVADVPFADFWDVAIITILVGMILTRIGCFLNGCCSGRPSRSWIAMNLPDHTGNWERRVPTQLLEAALAVILLIGCVDLLSRRPFSGSVFLFGSGGYAAGRLILESLREKKSGSQSYTVHHAISIAIVTACLATFALVNH